MSRMLNILLERIFDRKIIYLLRKYIIYLLQYKIFKFANDLYLKYRNRFTKTTLSLPLFMYVRVKNLFM